MPRNLDAGDRKLLIAAGALVVVLIVSSALLSPRQGQGISAYPSTYSAHWDGAKAAYLLLHDMGYKVTRWELPPTELKDDPSTQTLIFAEPLQSPSVEEKQAVQKFLENGGRVLAVGSSAAHLLPGGNPYEEGFPLSEKTRFTPVLPSPLIRDAPEIRMVSPQHWQPKSDTQLVVYGDDSTAAVVSYAVGKGQVVWWGMSTPMTNAGIRESGNLALFLNSIGPVSGNNILWDEYFHGAHASLWPYLEQTPLPWAIVQFGLVFLAILATHSRRQSPIHIAVARSRLSPLEFVETLGDLYSSAHAGPAAVRIAYQRLRHQLTRQFGLPGSIPDSDLAAAAHNLLSWNEGEFSTTLTHAQEAMNSTKFEDAATLEIVQQLFDYTSRLEPQRAPATERQTG
jgi:hypothetical protein